MDHKNFILYKNDKKNVNLKRKSSTPGRIRTCVTSDMRYLLGNTTDICLAPKLYYL